MDNNQNKPNTGALYKNKYKEQGDTKPEWSGPFTNERGDEMRVAVWLRTSKAGQPYMYVKVSEKREQQEQQHEPVAAAAAVEDTFFGDNGWSPE